jgi:Domain of unknown function (DUF4386)
MSEQPQVDHRLALGGFALAAGLLSLLLLASVTTPAPRHPEELLPYLAVHRSAYVLAAVTVLLWTTVSVPFTVSLGALLGAGARALAFAATLLSAGGVLLLGFATFASVGALLSIAAASPAAHSPADAAFQAALWSNLSFFLSDPGLMTLGLGQFLFAHLAWKSRLLPRLVSLIGYLGGLAGLLTLVVYQTPVLAVAQLAAFGVWGLATGAVLLRRRELSSGE